MTYETAKKVYAWMFRMGGMVVCFAGWLLHPALGYALGGIWLSLTGLLLYIGAEHEQKKAANGRS